MKRSKACSLITRIASDELIDSAISRMLFKARDIVVCAPNKVLDVLVTEKTRHEQLAELKYFCEKMSESPYVSFEIGKELRNLLSDLNASPEAQIDFNKPCCAVYINDRCKQCPNYQPPFDD